MREWTYFFLRGTNWDLQCLLFFCCVPACVWFASRATVCCSKESKRKDGPWSLFTCCFKSALTLHGNALLSLCLCLLLRAFEYHTLKVYWFGRFASSCNIIFLKSIKFPDMKEFCNLWRNDKFCTICPNLFYSEILCKWGWLGGGRLFNQCVSCTAPCPLPTQWISMGFNDFNKLERVNDEI